MYISLYIFLIFFISSSVFFPSQNTQSLALSVCVYMCVCWCVSRKVTGSVPVCWLPVLAVILNHKLFTSVNTIFCNKMFRIRLHLSEISRERGSVVI